jgi:hypothetical protein
MRELHYGAFIVCHGRPIPANSSEKTFCPPWILTQPQRPSASAPDYLQRLVRKVVPQGVV